MVEQSLSGIETSLAAVSITLATIIGYIGVTIMVYGAIKQAKAFVRSCIRRENRLPQIRIDLGKHLALGLEFLVGKDIIDSIVRPSWDDLGKLAVLILLRTFVTYVLSWELRELKEELATEKNAA